MSTLDSVLSQPPSLLMRRSSYLIMGGLLLFMVWAAFARLDEVAVAAGEIVPQDQIQSIQHPEGGIIESINAYEGDRVKKGQPLIQLNITSTMATRQELEVNLEGLQLKKARINAETSGKNELIFDESLQKFRQELINAEQQIFDGRQQKLASSLLQLKDQVEQKRLDVEQLETERNSIANNLSLLREKLRISSDLVKDKLTSKMDHLQLSSDVKELEGRLNVVNIAIPRSKAALQEAQERLRSEEISFRNQALDELTQVEANIAKTQEALNKASDDVQRTTIKSPIDGIIKSLKTHTIGGVVQPGEVIMEIVPQGSNLIVEARLNPNDIGFVKVGQPALVKVMTYDYARYGGLEGKVKDVSADSHIDNKTGAPYFLVKVQTDKGYLGAKENNLFITAGMQATVDIHTGYKSVMEYLLKPIIKIKEEAFRER